MSASAISQGRLLALASSHRCHAPALESPCLGSYANTRPTIITTNCFQVQNEAAWDRWVCCFCSCASPELSPHHPQPPVLCWRLRGHLRWGLGEGDGSEEHPERARCLGCAGDFPGGLIFPRILNTGADRRALARLGLRLHVLCLHSCKPESPCNTAK